MREKLDVSILKMKHGYRRESLFRRISFYYSLSKKQRYKLDDSLIWQLFMCKDDMARRLILGVSHSL